MEIKDETFGGIGFEKKAIQCGATGGFYFTFGKVAGIFELETGGKFSGYKKYVFLNGIKIAAGSNI